MTFDIGIFFEFSAIAISLLTTIITMILLQRIIFREYNTAKQRKIIVYLILFFMIDSLLCGVLRSFGFLNLLVRLLGITMLLLTPFIVIVSSVMGRKRAKWLGLFILIPSIGFCDALSQLISVPVQLGLVPEKYHHGYSAMADLLLLAVAVYLYYKKPKFIQRLEEDIEHRLLTVFEEAGLWAVGSWLFMYQVLAPVLFPKIPAALSVYLNVSNFIVAAVIVLLILNSNYRHYYYQRNMSLQKSLISVMADLVENRDENTGGHIQRTAKYVEIIARKLKSENKFTEILTDKYIEDMVTAAPLHDVGKIHIPDKILNKPGKLDDSEFSIMKSHASAGGKIIGHVEESTGDIDCLRIAKEMAEYHHEWVNGKGYPHGVSGDEIPLCAKILAVADVFDALVSKRCYKEPLSLEKAFAVIEECTGSHFDADVANAFIECRSQIEQFIEEIP